MANIKAMLAELGFKPSDRMIVAEEAMSRALGLELLAAFGPTCWIIFLDVVAGVGVHASATAARLQGMRRKIKAVTPTQGVAHPAHAATPASERGKADAVDRWFGDTIELAERAGPISCKHFWATPGFPGTQENAVWQRLCENAWVVRHDPNSGRPRYYSVRIKSRGPQLATVGGKVIPPQFAASA